MQVKIPYGKDQINVTITETYEILNPNKVEIKERNKIIENALKNPIGQKSIKEFIEESESLLIIVNDATKPTPTKRILEYLYPFIINHPDVRFLVATGNHRAPNIDEYGFIFGKLYDIFKKQIFVHDARNRNNMKYLGKTKSGTKVSINKWFLILEILLSLVVLNLIILLGILEGGKHLFQVLLAMKQLK